MKRWFLCLACLAFCALPVFAQEDPAALMPADVMVYAELDPAAVSKGVPELGLVKMLTDPRLRPFFQLRPPSYAFGEGWAPEARHRMAQRTHIV